MATAKKKSSAKRAVKTAKKVQSRAAHAAASVAKSTAQQSNAWAQKGAEWASQGANQWQQGANEWAKQSAKLYQLPFAGKDAAEVTQQAAQAAQSATENMMRASNEMMEKMFGANPMEAMTGFWNQVQNAGAQHKLQSMGRDAADQMSKAGQSAGRAANEAMEMARENAQAMIECSNIAASVSKEVGAELVSFMNKSFSQNVELSKQVLACRTLNDMFDLSTKMLKANFDAFFTESVKLSEKLFQCATDISEPLNERMSETSERMTRSLAA